jgi:Protein of unknown function (DUF2939)
MRKTIATVIILGLVWIGYVAWPIYDLLLLVRGMETRNVDTVTRHVYFDAVRLSLTRACTHNRPPMSAFGQTGHRADIAEWPSVTPSVFGSIHATCLSALVTDPAMEAWYHPSIAELELKSVIPV